MPDSNSKTHLTLPSVPWDRKKPKKWLDELPEAGLQLLIDFFLQPVGTKSGRLFKMSNALKWAKMNLARELNTDLACNNCITKGTPCIILSNKLCIGCSIRLEKEKCGLAEKYSKNSKFEDSDINRMTKRYGLKPPEFLSWIPEALEKDDPDHNDIEAMQKGLIAIQDERLKLKNEGSALPTLEQKSSNHDSDNEAQDSEGEGRPPGQKESLKVEQPALKRQADPENTHTHSTRKSKRSKGGSLLPSDSKRSRSHTTSVAPTTSAYGASPSTPTFSRKGSFSEPRLPKAKKGLSSKASEISGSLLGSDRTESEKANMARLGPKMSRFAHAIGGKSKASAENWGNPLEHLTRGISDEFAIKETETETLRKRQLQTDKAIESLEKQLSEARAEIDFLKLRVSQPEKTAMADPTRPAPYNVHQLKGDTGQSYGDANGRIVISVHEDFKYPLLHKQDADEQQKNIRGLSNLLLPSLRELARNQQHKMDYVSGEIIGNTEQHSTVQTSQSIEKNDDKRTQDASGDSDAEEQSENSSTDAESSNSKEKIKEEGVYSPKTMGLE